MKTKSIITTIFASALLFGGLTTLYSVHQEPTQVQEANAWSLSVKPDVQASYYSACDGKTGSSLKSALAGFNKPKSPNYAWERYEAADEAQDDSTSILCLYTRHNIKKTAHVGSYSWDTWNREHVFPQGNFPNSDKDNHNIFACEGQINNTRGNKSFAELNKAGSNLSPVSEFGHTTQCYTNSNYFEPCDDAKGEVARACMYCTIYYGYDLTDIFDSVATAVKWHSEHPVTAREIYRNNIVYGLQGNRNPFIDHPSYANTIFGGTYASADPLQASGSTNPDPVDPTPVNPDPTDPTPTNPDPVTPDPTDPTPTEPVDGGNNQTPVAKVLSKIEIKTKPTKVEYKVGEELDLSGLVVTASYTDGSTTDITDLTKLEINKPSTAKEGEKTVYVSYTEGNKKFSAAFTINVKAGGGCHGSILASSAILSITSLMGLGLLLFKRKEK